MMKDFKKIFKTFKDLLVSEDSLSTERVVDLQEEHEQILRAELESVPKVNLSRFSEDTLGTALIPEEQCGLRAVKVSGDGNCLYNSASVLIQGDVYYIFFCVTLVIIKVLITHLFCFPSIKPEDE